jgi:polysaccharide export outer membrane protein
MIKRIPRNILWLVGLIILTYANSSCKLLNQSVMLTTPKDYVFDTIPDTIDPNYRLSPNDIFTFRLFSNDGFKIIDMQNIGSSGNQGNMNMMNGGGNFLSYQVDYQGNVKLPILGKVHIAGKTIREAEIFLQEQYSYSFNDPYCLIEVNNRRVVVFPGNDGSAQVIPLVNENITLIETLALAGGISQNGKAKRIKVIRPQKDGSDPKVYELDLSTISGLQDGMMVMQANDIVYVTPRWRVATDLLREITPVLSLITTSLLLVVTIRNASAN